MRRVSVILLLVFMAFQLFAIPVSEGDVQRIAKNFLHANGMDGEYTAEFDHVLQGESGVLAHVYNLHPVGYLVVTADTDLPPVLAYSYRNEYRTILPDGSNMLDVLISTDLSDRLEGYTEPSRALHQARWDYLMASPSMHRPEQWPPEGTTETEGWVVTEWNQTYPYNTMCPMDPNSGSRSIAGCPAIAMGQIVNYHRTLNGTRLDDTDDYYHSYGGRNYWIDDDWEENDFPSFPALNTYLDTLEHKYMYMKDLTSDDRAALIFACGVAAQQVYSSGVSGTFGVDQSIDAYTRFGFEGFSCLDNDAPDLFERISGNIMDAIPVELALVTPAWDAGHHIVVDGYNTDDYYHLNFGWGGNSNGWYVLFENIPYDLTVVEGAIVDVQRIPAFAMFPEWIPMTAYVDNDIEFQILNISSDIQTIEGWVMLNFEDETIDMSTIEITPEVPIEISSAATVACTLHVDWESFPGERLVDQYTLYAVSSGYGNTIDLEFAYANDETAIEAPDMNLTSYPNPFNPETTVQFTLQKDSAVELNIYDIRGRKVRTLVDERLQSGEHRYTWNADGAASGVYLIRLKTADQTVTRKAILMK